jgi:hypothetical protein
MGIIGGPFLCGCWGTCQELKHKTPSLMQRGGFETLGESLS